MIQELNNQKKLDQKPIKIIRLLIPLTLYGIFFLSSAIEGFINPNQQVDFLNSKKFILGQITLTLILTSLFISLIFLLEKDSKSKYELKKIELSKLPYILIYLPITIILSLAIFYIATAISPTLISENIEPLTNLSLLPLIILMMMATGYMEEIFFRGYLIDTLATWIPQTASIIISSILFSIGHGYQGIAAIPATFALGLLFYFFRSHSKSIHIPAITHGLYNIITVLISLTTIKS